MEADQASILSREIDSVAVWTLNRPDKKNAFSRGMAMRLTELVDAAEQASPRPRAIVIIGAGRTFCSGADLAERRTMSVDDVRAFLTLMNQTFSRLEALPCVTIAAIDGYALGGGLELALCCDFRLAADTAQMGLTETRLGIIPGAGGTQRLPRLIGATAAKRMIYSGDRVTADAALNLKLIEKIEAGAALESAAIEFARQFSHSAPLALAAAKRSIMEGLPLDITSALNVERQNYEKILDTSDRLEALAAFAEKRPPRFTGN